MALTTNDVSAPVDTNPRKLLVVALTMFCVVIAPNESVAVRLMVPVTKAPSRSDPKKLPPIALTPAPKPENVIESVLVSVDSQGSAFVPAPKKPDEPVLAV